MKTRYIKVSGDTATPLPDKLVDISTHSLDLTDEQYASHVGTQYFKVVDGAPVAKSDAEVQEMIDAAVKANKLAESKAQLKEELEANVVEVRPGVFVRARTSDYVNIKLAYDSLADGEVYPDWHQGDQVFDLTKEELGKVLDLGPKQAVLLHQAHSQRVKEL